MKLFFRPSAFDFIGFAIPLTIAIGLYSVKADGPDPANKIESAGKAWVKGTAKVYRDVAESVRSGRLSRPDQIAGEIASRREVLGRDVATAVAPFLGDSGTVPDRETAARALEWLARGIEGGQAPAPPSPPPGASLNDIRDRLDAILTEIKGHERRD